jgi:hypothetical protein
MPARKDRLVTSTASGCPLASRARLLRARVPLTSALLLAFAAPAWAEGAATESKATVASPKLILHGASTVEIPLESASSITVNASGDLEAQCRDNTCPSGESGPSSVTAVLAPSATQITLGGAFSLEWSSQNSDICRGTGPTSVSGWSGQSLLTSGSKSLSLPVGEYTFSIRCYGVDGSATFQTSLVKVVPGTTPPQPPTGAAYCSEYYDDSTAARTRPTHESFTAYGLSRVEASWLSVFEVEPGATQSAKKVLPGNFLRPTATRYLAIPFVMTTDTDENLANIGMQWIEGGFYGSFLVPTVKSGATVFSVSPCPGDFRKSNNLSADPYERSTCRRTSPSIQGSNFSISSQVSRSGACYAPVGKVMYLNVASYDMNRTSLAPQTTCGSAETCGVSVQID